MLTKRQKQIYDFIAAYVAEHQVSPTFEEIAKAFGMKSKSNAYEFVRQMEKKGYARRSSDRLARSVELLGRQKICAVCGKIILGEEND